MIIHNNRHIPEFHSDNLYEKTMKNIERLSYLDDIYIQSFTL